MPIFKAVAKKDFKTKSLGSPFTATKEIEIKEGDKFYLKNQTGSLGEIVDFYDFETLEKLTAMSDDIFMLYSGWNCKWLMDRMDIEEINDENIKKRLL